MLEMMILLLKLHDDSILRNDDLFVKELMIQMLRKDLPPAPCPPSLE